MNEMIAYCGLVCTDCPAYIATQAGDRQALEKIAVQWREEYNAPDLTVDSVICDGCLNGGEKCSHCAECEIRACGVEKGILNCAHCDDYACEGLVQFFGFVPEARETLDTVRQSL
jgi:hypothetical protein